MKVLMFGWEFPPHISGGLGTACYGLTKAMAEKGLQILFVIPKARGDESADHLEIINASAVEVANPEKKTIQESGPKYTISKKRSRKINLIKSTKDITLIEVESSLNPYSSPHAENTWSLENWNYQFTDEMSEEKIQVKKKKLPVKVYAFSGTYGSNLMNEVEQLKEVAEVLARKYAFDIIHAHDWMTYPAGIAAKKSSGKPLVIHVHATEFDRSGDNINPKIFAVEKKGMQEADRIIAVSKWTKSIVTKKYDIPEEKIEVVYNGIAPSETVNGHTLSPIGSHMVTFLGRVTRQKGPFFFVEAARKVLRSFPDTHFVIAGSGDLLPQIIEQVASLKLSGKFHFTGFLSKELISKIWSMTHVYVMPSVSEPFGLTLLEAVQSRVPVIVSKQSGVSEVMPHAIKIDFWDTDALADAIASVLKFNSLRETLKRNGAHTIEQLTWEKAAEKIKVLYYALRNFTPT